MIGQDLVDASVGGLQFVPALTQFTRDASHEFDDEAFHEFVIIEKRAGVKFVRFFRAENTWVSLCRIGIGDLV
jgi:hypothetical protein